MLKLNSLNFTKIVTLNNVIGGSNEMGLNRLNNFDYSSLRCYGNCKGVYDRNGGVSQSGDEMILD